MTLYSLGMFYLGQQDYQDYDVALACLLSAQAIFEKGPYPGLDMIQQGIEELQTKISEETL